MSYVHISASSVTPVAVVIPGQGDSSRIDPASTFRFNLHFLKRIWRLFAIVFPSFCSVNTALFAFLLLLSVLQQITAYNVGMISSQYYKALGDKNAPLFWRVTGMSCALIVGMVAVKSTKTFVSGILYLSLRRHVTNNLHRQYFQHKAFYMLYVFTNIDNPDQRIAQDVERMCRAFSSIADTLLVSPFIIAYYTYQCVIITGWLGPGVSLAFFLLATIANRFLLQLVTKAIVRQEAKEGDFRHKHSQIRINAESAAFHDCEPVELAQCSASLESLLTVQRSVVLRQYALGAFVNLCDYAASILSYLALAVPIFAGVYNSLSGSDMAALISRTLFVMIYLFYQFTQLIDLSTQAGDIIGTSHRVLELGSALRECHTAEGGQQAQQREGKADEAAASEAATIAGDSTNNAAVAANGSGGVGDGHGPDTITLATMQPTLELRDLCVRPPGVCGRVLIKDLNLTLKSGDSILITGPSGCGKTALLRTICGLWQPGMGRVRLTALCGTPEPHQVLFAPQRPYFTAGGTLLQQVVFPKLLTAQLRRTLDLDWLKSRMQRLGLSELLERPSSNGSGGGSADISAWDVVADWPARLSPGEQQRLVALRCLYHRPPLLLLDEATSALDADREAAVYEILTAEIPELCLVSVGHRPSLRQYHRFELILGTDPGSHTLRQIHQQREDHTQS